MKHNQSEPTQEITHLLLTRFNLDYSLTDGKPYICDERWHQERFKLFFTYCMPSVKDQSCKDFTWLIFFNRALKNNYQKEIEKAERDVPQIEFIYVASDEDHLILLKNYVRTRVKSKFLISSRLDNDDIICQNYIEELQKKYHALAGTELPYLMNAGTGYQVEVKWPYRIGLVKGRTYSSFITLVCSSREKSDIITILDHQHQEWENKAEYFELNHKPAWIQVIHEKNLANRITTLRLTAKIKSDVFPKFPYQLSKLFRWFLYPIQIFISLNNKMSKSA